MDLLVRNGRVVDPARKIDTVTDIVIRDGKIGSIGSANVSDIPVFDATGLIVAPGFFDIHVHLREPGTEEAETPLARSPPGARQPAAPQGVRGTPPCPTHRSRTIGR